jgi:hypothetical protein
MNKWNTDPVYPFDGNAFSVMGAASKAMRAAGATKADIDTYTKDAMSGDYDHLLRVTMENVDLCAGPEPSEYDEDVECPECGEYVDDEGYCEECDEYTA